MTSLAAEGSAEGVACFRKRAGHAFAQAFGRRQRIVTPQRIESAACSHSQARASALITECVSA
jgi:hypothetical protein